MLSFGQWFQPLGLKPEITCTFTIIDEACASHGVRAILSSGVDRTHGAKSLHYAGLAVDVTWKGFQASDPIVRAAILAALVSALGSNYDVVLEDDHIHIEFQPKQPVNAHWRD